MFAGFNLTFMPQHFVGLLGMPRRVYTYNHGGLWETYNLLSTIGAGVMAVGVLLFFINAFKSRSGKRAGNDPWLADTLEWFAASPPAPENFTEPLPYVSSPRPLRDLRLRLKERDAAESSAPWPLAAPVRAAARRRRRSSPWSRGRPDGTPRTSCSRRWRCRPRGGRARAWLGHRRLIAPTLVALALFGVAALVTAPRFHLAAAALAFARRSCSRRSSTATGGSRSAPGATT